MKPGDQLGAQTINWFYSLMNNSYIPVQTQTEAHCQRLETDLGAARAHIVTIENGARAHAKDLERLSRMLDMTRKSEFEMSVKQVCVCFGMVCACTYVWHCRRLKQVEE